MHEKIGKLLEPLFPLVAVLVIGALALAWFNPSLRALVMAWFIMP